MLAWILRLFSRRWLAELDRAHDARQRAAVIDTFTTLSEGRENADEHLGEVLQQVLRVSPSALLKTDAIPAQPTVNVSVSKPKAGGD